MFRPQTFRYRLLLCFLRYNYRMSKTLCFNYNNALIDCLFVRMIIHYVFFFLDALLALLICLFVIIFILYSFETTGCSILVQICGLVDF